jgi:hypothetical protein
MGDAFSLGGIKLIHLAQQFQGVIRLKLLLCAYLVCDLNPFFRKEPLRLGAGVSPGSVVIPVNFCHLFSSFRLIQSSGHTPLRFLPILDRISKQGRCKKPESSYF